MRLEALRDFSRTRDCPQTKRKGPVSRTLRQVPPCGFPLGLALRLALEGVSLRSFLLLSNLPNISRRRKGVRGYESAVCGNKGRLLKRSRAGVTQTQRRRHGLAVDRRDKTPGSKGSGTDGRHLMARNPLQIAYFRPLGSLTFTPW